MEDNSRNYDEMLNDIQLERMLRDNNKKAKEEYESNKSDSIGNRPISKKNKTHKAELDVKSILKKALIAGAITGFIAWTAPQIADIYLSDKAKDDIKDYAQTVSNFLKGEKQNDENNADTITIDGEEYQLNYGSGRSK